LSQTSKIAYVARDNISTYDDAVLQKAVPLALIVVLGTALGYVAIQQQRDRTTSILPAHIASSATFPVYLPSDQLERFEIVDDSFMFAENVLLFEMKDQSSELRITVNEQERPNDFSFTDFYDKVVGATKTNTELGELYVGTFNGGSVASLLTEQTWIILRPQAEMDLAALKALALELKQSD
jgi:hypothetical protein